MKRPLDVLAPFPSFLLPFSFLNLSSQATATAGCHPGRPRGCRPRLFAVSDSGEGEYDANLAHCLAPTRFYSSAFSHTHILPLSLSFSLSPTRSLTCTHSHPFCANFLSRSKKMATVVIGSQQQAEKCRATSGWSVVALEDVYGK